MSCQAYDNHLGLLQRHREERQERKISLSQAYDEAEERALNRMAEGRSKLDQEPWLFCPLAHEASWAIELAREEWERSVGINKESFYPCSQGSMWSEGTYDSLPASLASKRVLSPL